MKKKLKLILLSIIMSISVALFSACDPGINTIGDLGGEITGNPYQSIIDQIIDQLKDALEDELKAAILEELASGTLDGILQEKFKELVDNEVAELLEEQGKQLQELLTKQLQEDDNLRKSFIDELMNSEELRDVLKDDASFLNAMKEEILTNSTLQQQILDNVLESDNLSETITNLIKDENSELRGELVDEFFSDENFKEKITSTIQNSTELQQDLAGAILNDTDTFGQSILKALQAEDSTLSKEIAAELQQDLIDGGISEAMKKVLKEDTAFRQALVDDVFTTTALSNQIQALFDTDPSLTETLIDNMLKDGFASDIAGKIFDDGPLQAALMEDVLEGIFTATDEHGNSITQQVLNDIFNSTDEHGNSFTDQILNDLMTNQDLTKKVLDSLLGDPDDEQPTEFMQALLDPDGPIYSNVIPSLLDPNGSFYNTLTNSLTNPNSALMQSLLNPEGAFFNDFMQSLLADKENGDPSDFITELIKNGTFVDSLIENEDFISKLTEDEGFLEKLITELIGETTDQEKEAILTSLFASHPHLFPKDYKPGYPPNPWDDKTIDEIMDSKELKSQIFAEMGNSNLLYNGESYYDAFLNALFDGDTTEQKAIIAQFLFDTYGT